MGDAGTIYFGVPRNARVSEVASGGSWNIWGRRSRLFRVLHRRITEETIPCSDGGLDLRLWRHPNNHFKDHFSAAETWQQIRDRRVTVPWNKVGWFSPGIPRYCFTTWLAVKNLLSTGDRMRSWGIHHHCTLCGERD